MFQTKMNAQQQLNQMVKLFSVRKEFAKETFVGKSFMNAVTVKIDGTGDVVAIDISPQALAEGAETISKFTAEAFRSAFKQKEDTLAIRVKESGVKLTGLVG